MITAGTPPGILQQRMHRRGEGVGREKRTYNIKNIKAPPLQQRVYLYL